MDRFTEQPKFPIYPDFISLVNCVEHLHLDLTDGARVAINTFLRDIAGQSIYPRQIRNLWNGAVYASNWKNDLPLLQPQFEKIIRAITPDAAFANQILTED
jgi:hypothetical protein